MIKVALSPMTSVLIRERRRHTHPRTHRKRLQEEEAETGVM